jgi:UDP-glucose 4-epimerase
VKVLITGGAGFIGTNLTLGLLNCGYEVKVLDDLSTGLKQNISKDAEFVNASILDTGQINGAI